MHNLHSIKRPSSWLWMRSDLWREMKHAIHQRPDGLWEFACNIKAGYSDPMPLDKIQGEYYNYVFTEDHTGRHKDCLEYIRANPA